MPTKERWAKMSEEEKQKNKEQTKSWRAQNKLRWNEYQKQRYLLQVGALKKNMNHTPETKAQWYRDKANRRCGRAKLARFKDELTNLVTIEAHDLRKRLDKLTGFSWHVDHIIPLKGKYVSGLHIWSNLAVIPKVDNLRKGNYYPIYA